MSLEADLAAEVPGKNSAQQTPRLQSCGTSVGSPTELTGTYNHMEKKEEKILLVLSQYVCDDQSHTTTKK